jgi:hypothetical protein
MLKAICCSSARRSHCVQLGTVTAATILFALLASGPIAHGATKVPPPSQTLAKLVVSGRTATAINITIVKVGQTIPTLVPGQQGKMKNTKGFTWYVSQHYAVKSNMDEAFSRHVLEISELSYPFAKQMVGAAPDGIENARMAIVYGKTRRDLDRSARNDIGSRLNFSGGGITVYKNRVAYNFPSGGLNYHRRDLVIHENFHMLEMNSPKHKSVAFGEYAPLAAGNHVYDSKKKQLTVFVMDKAPTNTPYDRDLRRMRKQPRAIQTIMTTNLWAKDYKMLGLQFFLTDPERSMKWRLWRDESIGRGQKDLPYLFKKIFGPADAIEKVWQQWVVKRRNTFHFADWGWEQDGNTLWSYGWPKKGLHARTDINLPPGEKPIYHPLVMDYPAEPTPALVGQIARGVAEPSVGCVIDYSRSPNKGIVGLGLGVVNKDQATNGQQPGYLSAMINDGKELILDGSRLGQKKKTVPLPEAMRKAMIADGRRIGLNAKITPKALEITLRAGPAGSFQKLSASLPISSEVRARLLTQPGAVLSRHAKHGVTPFFDAKRRSPPNLTKPAPPNRWRFAGLDELYGLYRAAYLLKDRAPKSLLKLRVTMLKSVEADSKTQTAAMANWRAKIAAVRSHVQSSGADKQNIADAIQSLSRISKIDP